MGKQTSLEFDMTFGNVLLHKLVQAREVCVPECHFPGTGYFPQKIWEIIRPKHLGTFLMIIVANGYEDTSLLVL